MGIGLDSEVQSSATDAFKYALDGAAAEATSFQQITTNSGTFYFPNFQDGQRNVVNLESLFVYYLNQNSSMPPFHVTDMNVYEPAPELGFTAQIQYTTWLGRTKTLNFSGNLPVAHKK